MKRCFTSFEKTIKTQLIIVICTDNQRVDALPPYYQHPHQYDMSMSYAAAAGTPYSHCDSSSSYASPMSHCSTTSSSSTSSSEANSTTTTTTTPTTTTSSVTPTTSATAGSNMIIRSSQPSSSSFVQINRDYICPYIECSKRSVTVNINYAEKYIFLII